MADLGQQFNYDEVEPGRSFEHLPAGEYDLQIVADEKRPTKNGDGMYLSCEIEVISGPYERRKIFQRFNLWSKSDKAKEIAWQQFGDLCRALGIRPKDTSELHFKPFRGRVKVVPGTPQYPEPSNEISSFKPANGEPPANSNQRAVTPAPRQTAAPARPTQPAASSGGGNVPPWKQKAA